MIKKGLFLFLFVLIILIWQSIAMYISVQTDKNNGWHDQIDRIQKETNVTIISAERFHGDQLYTIFLGNDENNQASFLVIDAEERIHQLSHQEITLNRTDVSSHASSQFSNLTGVIRVSPAYTDHQFTWEVVAQDTENHLQYIYYDMKNGAFQKRFILSK